MKKKDYLKEYHQKRNFDLSSEPFGEEKGLGKKDVQIFVIQKHDASQVHYDFRLSVNGVLKSWVIPKGPSTDPKVSRLAIPTEDHPLEYADFEGVIPEEEYGGGTVMVWDAGAYEPKHDEDNGKEIPIEEQIQNGHVVVHLKGKKIQGNYALIQTELNEEEKWLLKKMEDDYADARRNPTNTENKSVLTGRTMNQIRKAAQPSE